MEHFYRVEPNTWAGMTEIPMQSIGLAGTPVFIARVERSRTHKGLERIDFVQPLYPGGSRKRSIAAKIVQRSSGHLTCVFEEGVTKRTAIFSTPDFAWLDGQCPELLRRRPIDGRVEVMAPEIELPEWPTYLNETFGSTADEVAAGITPLSFAVSQPPMSDQRAILRINRRLSPFESCLVAHGFQPFSMSDRWFIYLEDGRLHFRRSWSGVLLYDLEANWHGDQLYLAQAYAERSKEQRRDVDDAEDTARLQFLIDRLLLGLTVSYPGTD